MANDDPRRAKRRIDLGVVDPSPTLTNPIMVVVKLVDNYSHIYYRRRY